MRTATAYFAGIGTVVAAIAAGLGGGLVIGDIMSPQQPKHPSSEVTRLEQRNSQAPITATNSAPQPVPYLATPQVAAAVAEPAQPQAEAPPQSQPQGAAVQPAETKQADTKQAADTNKTPPTNTQPVATAEPAVAKERASPEDAFAKARDADVKREARDRRRAERRQQWAEKRRMKPRERDGDDLREVEASVRQATEEPSFFGRPMFDREPRFGSRINLFEQD